MGFGFWDPVGSPVGVTGHTVELGKGLQDLLSDPEDARAGGDRRSLLHQRTRPVYSFQVGRGPNVLAVDALLDSRTRMPTR